jgi:flagellar biosynthetic protein FliS
VDEILVRSAALSRYQEIDLGGRVGSADPHSLVTLLYDELIASLDIISRSLAVGGPIDLPRHSRALALLGALESGLDLKAGSLALSLAQIYRQMQRRLATARDGNLAAVNEVAEGVRNLRDAWKAIKA